LDADQEVLEGRPEALRGAFGDAEPDRRPGPLGGDELRLVRREGADDPLGDRRGGVPPLDLDRYPE